MTSSISPVELAHRLGQAFPPTQEQQAAISAPLAPRVVVAGAGSGKTQTMGMRVVWLVANGHVETHRVLGLTFTRKAAAELGERVRHMLRRLLVAHRHAPFLTDEVSAGLRTGEPTVTTYHSYAAALVAEHGLRIGLEPDIRLVGEAMRWQLAAGVVESYDGPMDAVDRAVSSVIGDVLALTGELSEHLREASDVTDLTDQVRAHLRSLPPTRHKNGSAAALAPPVRELLGCLDARESLLPLVEAYGRAKRMRGVMDYGDQVAVAARIAREHPQVAELERGRFAAVLLDEYQDTGEAQRVLLTSLFAGGHPVTAVGDPRQSIYGWRGASAGNLERFGPDFDTGHRGGGTAGGLTVSFRNGERILAVANRLAAGIPVRGLDDRPLRPGPGRVDAGRVECALHDSVVTEADWIAERIAGLGAAGTPWGEIAVLSRKRSHFPRIEAALRARQVPCEVVGLGGLLLEPEVVDVVSTLRVLADPTAGAAVVRLLGGPRWRLGPRDLAALGRRARALAVPSFAAAGSASTGGQPSEDPEGPPPDFDVVDERSLVDALDDPGPPATYSAVGHARLLRLRDELRALRRWSSASLPELVGAVVRSLGLDVELASRPGVRPADALLNIDRLTQVAEEFVASGEDPGVVAFLAFLDTAEERERGLELEVPETDADRVQLMTVHAAKGLEWDAVFVAGMTASVFPVEGQPVADWTKQLATLPFPLRGDRAELPALGWQGSSDLTEARTEIERFRDACKDRGALEERRLAYVAVTRARELLTCSGYWWDTSKKPRGPSSLLHEVRDACDGGAGTVPVWADEPGPDATNPVTAEHQVAPWPVDPLGDRRPALVAAADLVLRAGDAGGSTPSTNIVDDGRPSRWQQDIDLLLEELARSRRRGPATVALPAWLSVSQLVALRRDPHELAREIRRPLPSRPAPQARRGTRFHLWLEHLWGQQRLVDVDELPGAADESAEPDEDLLALQEMFRASDWWSRVPHEVEFPFDIVIDGVVLRGRCDAVFTDAPDGLVDVVDWKTGRPPADPEENAVVAVQLAVYRLAWHHLSGVPLERIRAAFHYVAANATVRPADLLDETDLQALIRSVPSSGATHDAAPGRAE